MSLESNPNAEIIAEFVAESRETLEKVEPLIIQLEQGCSPESETLAIIFRCFHSFKGTASFLDLTQTAALAHSAESLLDLFRRGAAIEPVHVDLICRALDTFRSILDLLEADASDNTKAADCAVLVQALDAAVAELRSSSPSTRRRREAQPAAVAIEPTNLPLAPVAILSIEPPPNSLEAPQPFQLSNDFLGKFVAESEDHMARLEEVAMAFENGRVTREQVSEAFRAVHNLKSNCGICGFRDMEQLTHRTETLVGDVRDNKKKLDPQAAALVLDVVDALRSALATIPGGDGRIPSLPKLLARLEGTFQARLAEPGRVTRVPTVAPNESKYRTSLKPPADNTSGKGASSIRVDTEKLDELMNLVGELIIAETTVTKNPDLEGHDFENFQKAALNLNRLTRALQDIAMAVRMVPIAATFRKMIRLVRDVSAKQHKRIELALSGEDTEVDKTVIETIGDPLVHLIRNSIDHGIEPPEERSKSNKEPIGKVWLDAKHQGGEVWITIRDDGRGLNPEKLLNKALERGIAEPGRRYSEREIFDFIFAPGFSTAAQLTDISGRGVGMDVVRKNIEGVSGRVEVSSELGKGTTFVLRIPLTLAIIEGMLVRVGQAFYTIPLLAIRESVKAKAGDITRLSDGKELLKLRRHHYPIVKLAETHQIDLATHSALDGILVMVESNGQLACIMVDEVVGQRQTVIKPLPEYLRRVRGLSGCSILHNGDISLILDVEGIVGASSCEA